MTAESLITSWKKGEFNPVYLLHGEEDYFIDKIVKYAEHEILSPDQQPFNLTVFYGRDSDWASITNACRRYPMFSDRQLVILKEAQTLKEFEKLDTYVESPLSSTVFIIAYKGKSVDKRSRLFKQIQKKGIEFKSEKISENKIRDWIAGYVKSCGLAISSKSVGLIYEHVGNDLSRIAGEIEKLKLNLDTGKEINENDIEKYIGISKEYNIFELQAAIVSKNLPAALKIVNYFEGNPKIAPIQAALPALYSFFSRVHAAFGLSDLSDASLKSLFYNNYYVAEQAKLMMRNYGLNGIEKLIILLNHYNLKGVGVGDSGTEHAELIKEMVVKMMNC